MPPWRPTIAIVGAGAVGGYYGCRLARARHSVHFLLRSDFAPVSQNGFTILSRDGDFSIPPSSIHLYSHPTHMPPVDLVIVALKATANHLCQPLIQPLLKPHSLILTLQNGLGNEEQLAKLFPSHPILGGLAFVCLNRTAPGVIHHTDYGTVTVGQLIEGQTALAQQVVSLFASAGIDCRLLQSLRHGRWEKLVWNVPFNGLGAVLDMNTEQLMNSPHGLHLLRTIMAEVITAANALSIPLPASLIDSRLDFTRTMGPYHSSMQLDRHFNRPMEIEAILGNPVRAASAANVPTPYMTMLYNLAMLLHTHQPSPHVP